MCVLDHWHQVQIYIFTNKLFLIEENYYQHHDMTWYQLEPLSLCFKGS